VEDDHQPLKKIGDNHMAGRVTFIKPMGNNPHGDHDPSHYAQNLGMRIRGAGNVQASGYGYTPALTQSLAIAPSTPEFSAKNRVYLAVSPDDSGNVGTMKPFAGDFNRMRAGQYTVMGDMGHLAGQTNTLLNSPARLAWNSKNAGNWRGDNETGIASWDYATGAVTYNGRQGHWFGGVSPLSGASGVLEPVPHEASDISGVMTGAVPAYLVFNFNGQVPASSQYGPRHDQ
jgi:hypothetical protein